MRACVVGSCFERLDEGGGLSGVSIAFASALAEAGWQVDVATRIGDDPAGTVARDHWREAGIDDSRVQCDPDLATGRWSPRRRDSASPWIEAPAAFDHLQWDGDLASAASAARLVVTDLASRRNGQARSTIDRLLLEARLAVRVLDLTAEGGAGMALQDSSPLRSGLERADLVVADAAGLRLCDLREDELRSLSRRAPRMLLLWDDGQPARIVAAGEVHAGETLVSAAIHPAKVLSAFLDCASVEAILAEAERLSQSAGA